jgi:DNA polymerase-4
VIVAGRGPRAVVTTASYEARRFGVGSAMPASRARRLCPQAFFLTPDFPHYRSVSERVMGLVRAHVERVEVVGLDEAYLELSGLPAPKACMRRLRGEIERQTGLTASVGIGPNKLVAKVASDAEKPGGFVVLSRQEACTRFADAPCGLIPGIGERTAGRLAAIGIRTVAELAASSPSLLGEAGFGGRIPHHLITLARFEHDGAVSERRKVLSESRERTFDADIADPTQLERILDELVGELCAGLQRAGRSGRTVAIKVRLDDFSTHTRSRTLSGAVWTPAQVAPIARELLRAFAPQRPVRLLGVRLASLQSVEAEPRQLALTM